MQVGVVCNVKILAQIEDTGPLIILIPCEYLVKFKHKLYFVHHVFFLSVPCFHKCAV